MKKKKQAGIGDVSNKDRFIFQNLKYKHAQKG
jgi:hypothetical protein